MGEIRKGTRDFSSLLSYLIWEKYEKKQENNKSS